MFINEREKIYYNANNGCLGDFGRGRTQTTAIFVGEVSSTFDPAVSEWSNPPCFAGEPHMKLVSNGYISVWLGTA